VHEFGARINTVDTTLELHFIHSLQAKEIIGKIRFIGFRRSSKLARNGWFCIADIKQIFA